MYWCVRKSLNNCVQVADYAMRKKMDIKDAEKWLSPMLCYEP